MGHRGTGEVEMVLLLRAVCMDVLCSVDLHLSMRVCPE